MLLLLTDIRKKLLALWTAGGLAITVLLLLQTLGGRFEYMERQAWIWWAAVLLPVWGLLFIAALTNRNPARVLFASTYRQLRSVAAFYLLVAACTLVAVVWAARQMPVERYLALSGYWLLPLQLLVLGAVLLLFFRKEAVLRPEPHLLKAYLDKKISFARSKGNLTQLEVYTMLTGDDGVPLALDRLQTLVPNHHHDLIMVQSRYARWKEQRDLGTLDRPALQIELNRITVAAAALIDDINH